MPHCNCSCLATNCKLSWPISSGKFTWQVHFRSWPCACVCRCVQMDLLFLALDQGNATIFVDVSEIASLVLGWEVKRANATLMTSKGYHQQLLWHVELSTPTPPSTFTRCVWRALRFANVLRFTLLQYDSFSWADFRFSDRTAPPSLLL